MHGDYYDYDNDCFDSSIANLPFTILNWYKLIRNAENENVSSNELKMMYDTTFRLLNGTRSIIYPEYSNEQAALRKIIIPKDTSIEREEAEDYWPTLRGDGYLLTKSGKEVVGVTVSNVLDSLVNSLAFNTSKPSNFVFIHDQFLGPGISNHTRECIVNDKRIYDAVFNYLKNKSE